MGRYDRNRDDEGRFTGGSRGDPRWRDDDDFGRQNYGRSQQPPRDDRGRFMSEGETGDYYGNGRNENRDYGDWRQGGSRVGYEGSRSDYGYEEDSRYRGGGQVGHGGEYHGRDDYGRGDYGREDYGREDHGRDDPGGGRERDEFGRFTSGDDGDRRGGYARGGGRDYDDYEDRGGSRGRSSGQGRGWFGDSRGHAEAARERWQESRGSRYEDEYDDRERSSRGRGSRGRGDDDHRGWFGDPRGHAQAARLGWRHRQR